MLKRTLWLTLFGCAFGILEAAVVTYLRKLYYPEGFGFPLVLPDTRILITELWREAATLAMLLSVAAVAGRNAWDRFGIFCFLFGVWDLFFYLGLRWMLSWPQSLMTWDVLFLIPRIWTGPVLSPVLVAGSLVAGGLTLSRRATTRKGIGPTPAVWIAAGLSISLLLFSFMANHDAAETGTPMRFPWLVYGLGLAAGWVALGLSCRTR